MLVTWQQNPLTPFAKSFWKLVKPTQTTVNLFPSLGCHSRTKCINWRRKANELYHSKILQTWTPWWHTHWQLMSYFFSHFCCIIPDTPCISRRATWKISSCLIPSSSSTPWDALWPLSSSHWRSGKKMNGRSCEAAVGVEEKYIVDIWKRKDKETFYRNHEYLLQVMKELDLLCLPKVYDKKGNEVEQTAFFVPSMVKESPPVDLPTLKQISSGEALQMRFDFADILPPAVFNRVVCTSLTLWQVHNGQLYDGCVTLESGSQHVLVLQRQSLAMTVSLLHNKGPGNVDLNLCRAVQLYLSQTIQRILSSYQVVSDDESQDVFTITYKPDTFSQKIKESEDSVSTIWQRRLLIQLAQFTM